MKTDVHLSPREEQVKAALATSMSSKAISSQLKIKPGSLKVYVSRLYRKLAIGSRHELMNAVLHEEIDELNFIRLALMQRVSDLEAKLNGSS